MTRKKDSREKQIEAWLKEPTSPEEAYRHKLLLANHLNKDLAIDKFISEATPQAMSLYEVYLNAVPKGRANVFKNVIASWETQGCSNSAL